MSGFYDTRAFSFKRVLLPQRSSSRPCHCQAASSDSDSSKSETVQSELVNTINSQVAEARAKDKIRRGLDRLADQSKIDLINLADQSRQEIADACQEMAQRTDAALDAAAAQTQAGFDRIEERLKANRKQMEEWKRQDMAARAQIERNRQNGLFFKSLYEDPELAKLRKHYGPQEDVQDPLWQDEQARQQELREAQNRKMRQHLMTAMAVLSLGACAGDFAYGSHQTWQALLYAAIGVSITITLAADKVAERNLTEDIKSQDK